MTNPSLRNFLEIPYDELEKLNLEAKEKFLKKVNLQKIKEHYIQYLEKEERIKAVTVCFSDLEGRFHTLDYDKKYLLKSYDDLTFDGSSVHGLSHVKESDLCLSVDWRSFRWMPSDVFGPGKVLVFAFITNADGTVYEGDFRGRLAQYLEELDKQHGYQANVAVECEGFLFKGPHAEQHYHTNGRFEFVDNGGYFHCLPKDDLKIFIDAFAEAQRALAFENEKDHPEVAPSQFELNYTYTDALLAADLVQLYKLIARQCAANMGYTACFLPKPITGINGNGMHCNISISKKDKNLFYSKTGEDNLSDLAQDFVDRILVSAADLCLILNPSVNSYRRLDPAYEAPNQIKSSAVDRTSMIRIPLASEKRARIEVRSVAPDCNPYMCFYSLLKVGLEGPQSDPAEKESKRFRTRFLPGNIYDALRVFKNSELLTSVLGSASKEKYIGLKQQVADRCPRALGSTVKVAEIIYHHEVSNQYLWSLF
jgi:glutamine synthetase